jgi:hypothetical protein
MRRQRLATKPLRSAMGTMGKGDANQTRDLRMS